MSVNSIISIINKVFFIIFLIATLLYLYRIQFMLKGFDNDKPLKKASTQKKFAVLIPARNESNVIERLLKSLQEQNYNSDKFDVYVIVESITDKTVDIVKKYKYNYFVRTNLENKGKGYALDECIQEILKNKKDYDLMAVVDADNILAPNFLDEMNNASNLGYQMGKAYHKELNEEGNVIADCSTLTFSGMNTFQNKARTKLGLNIIASGTGFFIDFDIIRNLNGWPFHTLTEDYELSVYMTIKNMKTIYVPTTYYYDEQPTSYHVLRKQRVRWIKGFSQVREMYANSLIKSIRETKENLVSKLDIGMGVIPNVLYTAGLILYEIIMLGISVFLFFTHNTLWHKTLKYAVFVIAAVYLVLAIYTVLQLFAERNKTSFSLKNNIKIILFNPIFIFSYIPQAIEAYFCKNIGWDPIEHGVSGVSKASELVEVEQEEDEVKQKI